jgi:hypothetical protein
MADTSLRQRLARVHPFVWIAAVAAIGALIAWPLGGWDTVELESTKIPVAQPGETIPGHEFSVSIDSAELTSVHPDGFSELEPGWAWLRLELTVVNETDITAFSSDLGSDYEGVVTLDHGVAGYGTTARDSEDRLATGAPYLISDGTYLPGLQPALPTRLALIFEVPDGTWTVGDELTVGIIDRTAYESTLGTGTRYGFPQLIAEVPVTVEQGEQA